MSHRWAAMTPILRNAIPRMKSDVYSTWVSSLTKGTSEFAVSFFILEYVVDCSTQIDAAVGLVPLTTLM